MLQGIRINLRMASQPRLLSALFTSRHKYHISSSVAYSVLHNLLKTDVTSGNFPMQPTLRLSSVNRFLSEITEDRCYDHVILLYAKMSSLGMPRDVYTYNILINCFCKLRRFSDGLVVLGCIFRNGYMPDLLTFNALIEGLCIEGKIDEGGAVCLLRKMNAFGCQPNLVTFNTLVDGFCENGKAGVALRFLYETMNGNSDFFFNFKPDVVSYATVIHGLFYERLLNEAKQLFVEMKSRGIRLNVYTFSSLMHDLSSSGRWEGVKCLFSEMLDQGVQPDLEIYNQLIEALSMNSISDGFAVMGCIIRRDLWPDFVTFDTLINGLLMHNKIKEAVHLLKKMDAVAYCPIPWTYDTIVDILCGNKMSDAALELYGKTVDGNYKFNGIVRPNLLSYSTMIHALCLEGLVDKAKQLFVEMKRLGIFPEVEVYNFLMDGLCFVCNWGEVKCLLSDMSNQGVRPNSHTLHILRNALSKISKRASSNKLNPELQSVSLAIQEFLSSKQLLK